MKDKLKIKNDQGIEKEFDILYSFKSKNTGKDYVVYTDFTKENNIINCYASIYEDGKLLPENKVIETMINTISATAKTKYQLHND